MLVWGCMKGEETMLSIIIVSVVLSTLLPAFAQLAFAPVKSLG